MLGRALDRSEGFLGRVRAVLAGTRGIICFRRDCAGVDVALRVERRRIARELHDALGNRLVVIIMHARRLPESERPAAESIGGLATLAMQDMRQVIGGLHDGVRDDAPPEPQLVSEEVAALAALLPAGRIMVSERRQARYRAGRGATGVRRRSGRRRGEQGEQNACTVRRLPGARARPRRHPDMRAGTRRYGRMGRGRRNVPGARRATEGRCSRQCLTRFVS